MDFCFNLEKRFPIIKLLLYLYLTFIMANNIGSVFFEDLKHMKNMYGEFRMPNNYLNESGQRLVFNHINSLRITKIKMVREYERVFTRWLEEKLAGITNQFEFVWLGEDKRDLKADDTVGYLTCKYNFHHFECVRVLDGETFGG